jgi:hypothetical protein
MGSISNSVVHAIVPVFKHPQPAFGSNLRVKKFCALLFASRQLMQQPRTNSFKNRTVSILNMRVVYLGSVLRYIKDNVIRKKFVVVGLLQGRARYHSPNE